MSREKCISDKDLIINTLKAYKKSPLDRKNIASSYFLLGMVFSMQSQEQEKYISLMEVTTLPATIFAKDKEAEGFKEIKLFHDIVLDVMNSTESQILPHLQQKYPQVSKDKWEYFLIG